MNPCNLPCPKCGSADINRLHHERGSKVKNKSYDLAPHSGFTPRGWESFAIRDCIVHHCRCCQFEWTTKSLPAPKKVTQGKKSDGST